MAQNSERHTSEHKARHNDLFVQHSYRLSQSVRPAVRAERVGKRKYLRFAYDVHTILSYGRHDLRKSDRLHMRRGDSFRSYSYDIQYNRKNRNRAEKKKNNVLRLVQRLSFEAFAYYGNGRKSRLRFGGGF